MSRRINVLDAVLLFPALPPTRPRPRWQCHPASAPVTTSDRNLRSLIERVEHVLTGHGSVSFTLDQYGQLYPNSNETFLSKLNAATASIAPAGADDAIYDKVVARQRPRGVAGLLGHVLHPSHRVQRFRSHEGDLEKLPSATGWPSSHVDSSSCGHASPSKTCFSVVLVICVAVIGMASNHRPRR